MNYNKRIIITILVFKLTVHKLQLSFGYSKGGIIFMNWSSKRGTTALIHRERQPTSDSSHYHRISLLPLLTYKLSQSLEKNCRLTGQGGEHSMFNLM